MKRTLLIFGCSTLLIAGVLNAHAADSATKTFDADPVHSQVGFKVKHMGLANTHGRFEDFSANWVYDPEEAKNWKVWASIKTSSLDTDQKKRDDHLKSADFFDAKKFPEMTFQSTEVSDLSKGSAKIKGNLTIKGVTKEVTMDAEFSPVKMDDEGKPKMSLTAHTQINRKDFGLTWSHSNKAGELIVGDEVMIELDIEGTGQKAADAKKPGHS